MAGHSIADKQVLSTGANRGLVSALVNKALRRGAAKVYAGTRPRSRTPTYASCPCSSTARA